MNNLVSAFQFQDFDIRIWEEEGLIYAVGRDIAAALGYQQPSHAVSRHCKGCMPRTLPTAGGMQEMQVITEGDIFALINKSELPSAKQFQHWVNYEVLPTLRKTGSYSMPGQHDNNLIESIANRVGDAFALSLGKAISSVTREQDLQRHDHNMLEAKVRDIEARQTQTENKLRKPFKQFDKNCMVQVAKRYGGYMCACCHNNKVLNDNGEKLNNAHFDHAMHRGKADRFHGWLVCSDCNNRFKTDRNDHDNAKFTAYQAHMNELFPAKIIALPDQKPKQFEMI